MTDTRPLRIVNGRVTDPAGAGTRQREVWIADGRIVAALSDAQRAAARTIDAGGRCVMPGAIDMHSHIASRGVALAASREEAGDADTRLIGSPREIARGYVAQGWTTVIDAAVPPHESDFARAQLERMPNLDAGFLAEIGSDDTLLRTLAERGEDAAIAHLGRVLDETDALGLKAVNPGLTDDLDTPLGGTNVTARDLLRVAAKAIDEFGVSHPLHMHAPRLGEPGNVRDTITTLESVSPQRVHLAHAQFSAYGKHTDGGSESGAAELLDYSRRHPRVTMDTGCIGFGPAWMITRDALLAPRLARVTRQPLTQRDGWSVMPLRYDPAQPINALQWAIGLELILRSADRTRLALTVDFPNGGSFRAMPELMRLLASPQQRAAMLDTIHPWARERTSLGELTGALDEQALVTLTRVAPANALGLSRKGHLSPGADADVVIADRPEATPAIVIKSGRVVLEDGVWQDEVPGKRLSHRSG